MMPFGSSALARTRPTVLRAMSAATCGNPMTVQASAQRKFTLNHTGPRQIRHGSNEASSGETVARPNLPQNGPSGDSALAANSRRFRDGERRAGKWFISVFTALRVPDSMPRSM